MRELKLPLIGYFWFYLQKKQALKGPVMFHQKSIYSTTAVIVRVPVYVRPALAYVAVIVKV